MVVAWRWFNVHSPVLFASLLYWRQSSWMDSCHTLLQLADSLLLLIALALVSLSQLECNILIIISIVLDGSWHIQCFRYRAQRIIQVLYRLVMLGHNCSLLFIGFERWFLRHWEAVVLELFGFDVFKVDGSIRNAIIGVVIEVGYATAYLRWIFKGEDFVLCLFSWLITWWTDINIFHRWIIMITHMCCKVLSFLNRFHHGLSLGIWDQFKLGLGAFLGGVDFA